MLFKSFTIVFRICDSSGREGRIIFTIYGVCSRRISRPQLRISRSLATSFTLGFLHHLRNHSDAGYRSNLISDRLDGIIPIDYR